MHATGFGMSARGCVASRFLAVTSIAWSMTGSLAAAGRETIKVDWSGFQRQVAARKLEDRKVLIMLAGGGEVKTNLLAAAGGGLVVRANRATKQWASARKEATIPKDQIRSVRFLGHLGHRGLFAGLAAFGAALGIGVALAKSQDAFDITEGPAALAAPLSISVGALGAGVAGYFIGRATSRQAPEFVIVP